MSESVKCQYCPARLLPTYKVCYGCAVDRLVCQRCGEAVNSVGLGTIICNTCPKAPKPSVEITPGGLRCPKCGAPEPHPDGDKVLIRAYKRDNRSQCLVCSGFYNADWKETPERHDPKKGWF